MSAESLDHGHRELRARFRRELEKLASQRYHHKHPFNLLMHAGRLSRADLGIWVANRYYYQTRIPIKDALVLAKAEDSEFRRVWLERMRDHDGRDQEPGGLALWRRLGHALEIPEAQLVGFDSVVPGVRQACDDYVELVREGDLLEAVAASLTECFAKSLMKTRIEAWRQHYPYVAEEALGYFRERLDQAGQDGAFALDFVLDRIETDDDCQRCLAAFERKCEILWRLLDAVYVAARGPMRPHLHSRATIRRLDRESDVGVAVLVSPEAGLGLNPSALELLDRCGGDETLERIVGDLSVAHHLSRAQLIEEVATFLGELERRRLLVFEDAP